MQDADNWCEGSLLGLLRPLSVRVVAPVRSPVDLLSPRELARADSAQFGLCGALCAEWLASNCVRWLAALLLCRWPPLSDSESVSLSPSPTAISAMTATVMGPFLSLSGSNSGASDWSKRMWVADQLYSEVAARSVRSTPSGLSGAGNTLLAVGKKQAVLKPSVIL